MKVYSMIHTMQSSLVTTNVRLNKNDLSLFRVAAANENISFNQFALKALRAEATKQFFPQKLEKVAATSTGKRSVKSILTLYDLPRVFKKQQCKGEGLTELDAEIYES